MCWAHVERAIETRLKTLHDTVLANQVLNDIRAIQISHSIDVFELANKFFFKKYRALNNQLLNAFLSYYEKEWINSLFWHEGLGWNLPATNNGLESTNNHLKENHTFRERAPLSYFRPKLFDIAKRFSSTAHKEFEEEPDYNKQERDSNCFIKQKPKIWKEDGLFYIANDASVDNAVMKTYMDRIGCVADCGDSDDDGCDKFNNFDFDQFEYLQRAISVVEFDADDWKKSKCNCWYFLKNYQCRHVMFLAVLNNKAVIPLVHRQIPIDNKQRKGRIANALKAFVVQDNNTVKKKITK